MADHVSTALVEERKAVMHPPNGGNPTLRKAHFLKPLFEEPHKDLPPAPCSLISLRPSYENRRRCNMQSYKLNPSEKWKIWVERLKPRWQEMWKQAGIYEAILASTHTVPKDKNLIIGLAERWCSETNTFVFSWGEVSITLEDVIFLGNFSVLGASFSAPVADEYVYVLDCLKNAHKECAISASRNVSVTSWMKYFMCGGSELEHEAFLAMWLSKFVVIGSGDHIAVRNLHAAVHLSRGNRIALAPFVLASIYKDMRLLHNSIVESVVDFRFSVCHVDLVHMWAWERFLNLRPTPGVVERGEPRSARWSGVKITRIKDVRAALDSARESFMWRPYSITLSDCVLSNLYRDDEQWVVVDSDDTESYARCLRVSWLVGSGHVEQYLPHRVAMQFGYDQDVPPCVVRPNLSPETAWRSYSRSLRGTKLYIPPRLFESDVSSRYKVWWRGFRAVNEEMQASCMSEMKSFAMPGSAEGRSEDNIAVAQLMSQSRKSKNSGKRSDLDNEQIINDYGVETSTSISSSSKLKSSRSPGQRQEPEPKEDAVVSKCSCYTAMNPEFVEERREDIEEDRLTINQLLSRSRSKGFSRETGGGGGETEAAVVSRIWKCTNESVGLSKQSISSSGKHNKCDSPTDNPIKNDHTEVNNNDIVTMNDEVVSRARCPEHGIVNIEEESSDNTKSESPQLDLEARIWRLEKIFDNIKAEKLAASLKKI